MRPAASILDKTRDDDGAREGGYDRWKREKIERGLAEAEDRSRLIPVEQILRDL